MSLLSKVNRYLRETEMAPTRFGRLAARDPRLVGDLRRGREPRGPMTARVERFIAESRAAAAGQEPRA